MPGHIQVKLSLHNPAPIDFGDQNCFALIMGSGEEIAERIDRDKSTVTALVDKLVRLGYVAKERDSEDTRVVYVTLTEKGDELRPIFEEISSHVIGVFYKDISENEKEELLRILNQLYNNF
jgi:DNA-binding MarR family transcriptional regulator